VQSLCQAALYFQLFFTCEINNLYIPHGAISGYFPDHRGKSPQTSGLPRRFFLALNKKNLTNRLLNGYYCIFCLVFGLFFALSSINGTGNRNFGTSVFAYLDFYEYFGFIPSENQNTRFLCSSKCQKWSEERRHFSLICPLYYNMSYTVHGFCTPVVSLENFLAGRPWPLLSRGFSTARAAEIIGIYGGFRFHAGCSDCPKKYQREIKS